MKRLYYSKKSLLSSNPVFLNTKKCSRSFSPCPLATTKEAFLEPAKDIFIDYLPLSELTSSEVRKSYKIDQLATLVTVLYVEDFNTWLIVEAQSALKIFTMKEENIKYVKYLQRPNENFVCEDKFAEHRPIVVWGCSNTPYSSRVSYVAVNSREEVLTQEYGDRIEKILTESRVIILLFCKSFWVLDYNFDRLFTIDEFPIGIHGPVNTIAVANRWLAYCDYERPECKSVVYSSKIVLPHDDYSTLVDSTKTALKMIGSIFTKNSDKPLQVPDSSKPKRITIMDCCSYDADYAENCILAHFCICSGNEIKHMKFSPKGTELVVADIYGHYLYVYQLIPNQLGPSFAIVHHIYSLFRGSTPADIVSISITNDCRWVTSLSSHGTVHSFPICPYGGPPSSVTHQLSSIPNKDGPENLLPKETQYEDNQDSNCDHFKLRYLSCRLPRLREPIAIQSHQRIYVSTLQEDESASNILLNMKKILLPVKESIITSSFVPMGWKNRKNSCPHYELMVATSLGGLYNFQSKSMTVSETDTGITIQLIPYCKWNLRRNKVEPSKNSLEEFITLHLSTNPSFRKCQNSQAEPKDCWVGKVIDQSYLPPNTRLWMSPQFSFHLAVPNSCSGEEDGNDRGVINNDLFHISVPECTPLYIPQNIDRRTMPRRPSPLHADQLLSDNEISNKEDARIIELMALAMGTEADEKNVTNNADALETQATAPEDGKLQPEEPVTSH